MVKQGLSQVGGSRLAKEAARLVSMLVLPGKHEKRPRQVWSPRFLQLAAGPAHKPASRDAPSTSTKAAASNSTPAMILAP